MSQPRKFCVQGLICTLFFVIKSWCTVYEGHRRSWQSVGDEICLSFHISHVCGELGNKSQLSWFSFLLTNESGCQTLLMYCCKTPPTAKSLASHVIFNGAEWSGCTKRVALASICLDSMNAKYALLFHFKSKLDLGDNLVWPSLTAVSNLSNGVNLFAQCGMDLW